MKIYLLALLSTSTFLYSCDKKGDPDKVKSRTELVVSNKWRITALSTVSTSGGKTTTEDGYATTPECEKDDTFQFFVNKDLTIDHGTKKCYPAETQQEAYEWEFTTVDESKILIGLKNSIAFVYDVQEITATKMILTYPSKFTNSTTGLVVEQINTVTYTAQ